MVFLTGGAALVYELVWTRWLTLLLGASAQLIGAVELAALKDGHEVANQAELAEARRDLKAHGARARAVGARDGERPVLRGGA